MKALTPAGFTRLDRSPRLPRLAVPTFRPQPRGLPDGRFCQSPQRHRLLPGFTTNEQARHSVTPNRVRHPTDCRFISGCSPPRLAATRLPSITEPATGSGADLHRADKAPSRGALVPAEAGNPRISVACPKPPLSRGRRIGQLAKLITASFAGMTQNSL